MLALLGPGILVAATGVGAGDLATGAFSGSHLGLAVLWAVVVGALLKGVLNEGLARWQLATGETLLEGGARHLGRVFQGFLLVYLVFWSFFVGAALMNACGAAAHALIPLFDTPREDKIFYGLLHSAFGALAVWRGGFRLFSRLMSFFIGIMFVTVTATALLLTPDWGQALQGLLIPSIPDAQGQGRSWTIALIGGVGGTLTVLCYGYWIREEGREGPEDLRTCRLDLTAAYVMTAVFGISMVIIGSTIQIDGRGADLIVALAHRLQEPLGSVAQYAFLVGAWGAMASSLLGVWQSVPYLFADSWRLLRKGRRDETVDSRSRPYRWFLAALATVPAIGLWESFQQIQKIYAIVGAAFMPILALTLLLLNGSSKLVGREMRNGPLTTILLLATLAFFAWAGWQEALRVF